MPDGTVRLEALNPVFIVAAQWKEQDTLTEGGIENRLRATVRHWRRPRRPGAVDAEGAQNPTASSLGVRAPGDNQQ